ncbi:MAG: hypothetical protein QW215_03165 [Ignisphaera sp.]
MTRLRPEIGSLKELTITMRTPHEELLSTPETLPTTEPSTSQIVYTVSEEDLPALSMGVYRVVWVAFVIGAGRFTTAGYVYWRMLRNGTSISTGNRGVSADYYYTVNTYFYDVKVGDVLELRLWSSVSDSVWDYRAFQIQPTRILPHARYRNLYGVSFDGFQAHPVLTLGNPSVYGTGSSTFYHTDIFTRTIGSAFTVGLLIPSPTYGLFRLSYGDYQTANYHIATTSASYRPYYYRNSLPTMIRFRFLYLV